MRILISFYSPWWNAPAYYAVSLAEKLSDTGHDICFVGQGGTPSFARALCKIPVCYDAPLQHLRPDILVKSVRTIRKAIEDFRPEVINCHSAQDFSLMYAALLGRRGLPVRVVRTRCDHRPVRRNICNRFLYARWSSHVIFPSAAAKRRAEDVMDIDGARVSVIYAGIDLERFSERVPEGMIRQQFGLGRDTFVAGIIARLSPVKGHDYFLRMAELFSRRFPDSFFVISGEDAQISKSDLLRQAAERGIANKCAFLGKVADPRAIMRDLDAGIITSQDSEVICRVAAEYMAMGTPVLATDVNVLPEMVMDGKTGYISPANDPAHMAERLYELASDREKKVLMGKEARKRAEDGFNLSRTARETVDVFRALSA